MKKLAIAITSLLFMTGCASTPTITNTNNIKEHILKDNVAYESFSSYSDSDSIIRLPNGEYIHGTKEVNGKYYDSDQDSGAIQAKKAKYYALLATDVNNYLTEEFEGFNDSDEVFYNNKGSFTNASTVIDENGNEIVTMTVFVGDSIDANASKIIDSTYGDDLTKAASIEYEVVKS